MHCTFYYYYIFHLVKFDSNQILLLNKFKTWLHVIQVEQNFRLTAVMINLKGHYKDYQQSGLILRHVKSDFSLG